MYFDYYVDGIIAEEIKPSLIQFKPVGQTGGAIEFSDYKYGDIRFEVPAGTYSDYWGKGSIDMVLGQVSKKLGDEDKWFTGVTLSFEFQGSQDGVLKLGVDNVVVAGY